MVIPGHNLGNSQVSINRTIGPTLVVVSPAMFDLDYHFFSVNTKVVLKTKENVQEIKLSCRNATQLNGLIGTTPCGDST